jgi:hypothetical protein
MPGSSMFPNLFPNMPQLGVGQVIVPVFFVRPRAMKEHLPQQYASF